MSEKIFNERVKLKQAYESPAADDGKRVLVDRLWPRGVKKTEAAIDHWMKELAPSTELRKWFGHDPARWEEFRRRYAAEINEHRDQLDRLRDLTREGAVTLVYSAHDEAHNDAVVLREILLRHRLRRHAAPALPLPSKTQGARSRQRQQTRLSGNQTKENSSNHRLARSVEEKTMKFFVNTADISEIRELAAAGVLDGVTTNPSLIAKTGRPIRDVIKRFARRSRVRFQRKSLRSTLTA